MFYKIWSGAINKLDENNLPKPCFWIIKEKDKLYTNNFIFDTEEEAKTFISKQEHPEFLKQYPKNPAEAMTLCPNLLIGLKTL